MAISSVITVVPFQVGEQLNYYWKFRVYKIVICLKCQNLKKLQRMEKYKNWSHYYVRGLKSMEPLTEAAYIYC
jgi:hypothetical protein